MSKFLTPPTYYDKSGNLIDQFGSNTANFGGGSVVIGSGASIHDGQGSYAMAIGAASKAAGNVTAGQGAIAVGYGATAGPTGSAGSGQVAIGAGAVAVGNNSIAIGLNAEADSDNYIQIGATGTVFTAKIGNKYVALARNQHLYMHSIRYWCTATDASTSNKRLSLNFVLFNAVSTTYSGYAAVGNALNAAGYNSTSATLETSGWLCDGTTMWMITGVYSDSSTGAPPKAQIRSMTDLSINGYNASYGLSFAVSTDSFTVQDTVATIY